MLLKTKITLIVFIGSLICYQFFSGAPLRVRFVECAVLIVAFLLPAFLIEGKPLKIKIGIVLATFTLGAIIHMVGFALTVLKFELEWTGFALVPVLFLWFGLLLGFNEGVYFLFKKLGDSLS